MPQPVKQIVFNEWTSNLPSPDPSVFLEVIGKVERYQADATDVRGKRFIAMVHCRLVSCIFLEAVVDRQGREKMY